MPTFAFNLKGLHPRQVTEELGKREIYVWDWYYYAISVTESLGVEESGGMVRPQKAGTNVSAVHYNPVAEIERFSEVLGENAPNRLLT